MASDIKLGNLVAPGEKRDAIHIAVAPVIAGEQLVPGSHVGFLSDGRVGVRTNRKIGVIDPFLTGIVNIGQEVWLMLYPGTITSLRHDWVHPSFQDEESRKEIEFSDLAVRRLRQIAGTLGMEYIELMHSIEDGEFSFGDTDGPDEGRQLADEMCRLYGIVTGKNIDPDNLSFRCSC